MMMMMTMVIIIIIVLLYTQSRPRSHFDSNWILFISSRRKRKTVAFVETIHAFSCSWRCPLLSSLLPSARPTWSCLLSSSNTSAPRNLPIVATRCLTRSHPSARRCLQKHRCRFRRRYYCFYCFCQTTTLSRRRSTSRT